MAQTKPIRVLVQAGHVAPREPGFEGGTGTVREQEFTRAIRDRLCALLARDPNYAAIPQPGDLTNVPCDAAIFCHGDGATNPAASGRSFGFPVHETNRKLVDLLETRLASLPGAPPKHADNYTGGLLSYYGYSRITTAGPEVLIEFGFLTNPAEQKWMFANLDAQANAVYQALCDFFKTKPSGYVKNKRAGWVVVWTDRQGVEHKQWTLRPKRLVDKLWGDGIRRRILVRRKPNAIPSKEE